jgi:hypothetical protein
MAIPHLDLRNRFSGAAGGGTATRDFRHRRGHLRFQRARYFFLLFAFSDVSTAARTGIFKVRRCDKQIFYDDPPANANSTKPRKIPRNLFISSPEQKLLKTISTISNTYLCIYVAVVFFFWEIGNFSRRGDKDDYLVRCNKSKTFR